MSQQETVNAISDKLGQISTQLTKGIDEVVAKIAELAANNESVDFTAVNEKLEALSSQAATLDAVVPDAVENPPAVSPGEPQESPLEVPPENV